MDSSRSNGGLIGVGGAIRDSSGNWINGFMFNIVVGEVVRLRPGEYHLILKCT